MAGAPEFGDSEQHVETSPNGRYIRYNAILGKGAYKTVYKAFDTEEALEVAWNKLNVDRLSEYDLEKVSNEVSLLRQVEHKNIIRFYDTWHSEGANGSRTINFITEQMISGTLKEYLKKAKAIKLKVIRRWCRNILEAIAYLHLRKPPIMHRDLKCDNIFINGHVGEVKIGDLGLSGVKERDKAESVIGTPEFMAPELYEESYTEKVDIYAFGMCLLEIVTMEYPYSECNNMAQIFKKVFNGERPGAFNMLVDGDVKDVIASCLNREAYRPSAAELLEHPLFKDWETDPGKVSNLSLVKGAEDTVQNMLGNMNTSQSANTMPIGTELIDWSDPLRRSVLVSMLDGGETKKGEEQQVSVVAAKDNGEFYIGLEIPFRDAIKRVEFTFDPFEDNSQHIAQEMVSEFCLDQEQLSVIRAEIDRQVQRAKEQREAASRNATPQQPIRSVERRSPVKSDHPVASSIPQEHLTHSQTAGIIPNAQHQPPPSTAPSLPPVQSFPTELESAAHASNPIATSMPRSPSFAASEPALRIFDPPVSNPSVSDPYIVQENASPTIDPQAVPTGFQTIPDGRPFENVTYPNHQDINDHPSRAESSSHEEVNILTHSRTRNVEIADHTVLSSKPGAGDDVNGSYHPDERLRTPLPHRYDSYDHGRDPKYSQDRGINTLGRDEGSFKQTEPPLMHDRLSNPPGEGVHITEIGINSEGPVHAVPLQIKTPEVADVPEGYPLSRFLPSERPGAPLTSPSPMLEPSKIKNGPDSLPLQAHTYNRVDVLPPIEKSTPRLQPNKLSGGITAQMQPGNFSDAANAHSVKGQAIAGGLDDSSKAFSHSNHEHDPRRDSLGLSNSQLHPPNGDFSERQNIAEYRRESANERHGDRPNTKRPNEPLDGHDETVRNDQPFNATKQNCHCALSGYEIPPSSDNLHLLYSRSDQPLNSNAVEDRKPISDSSDASTLRNENFSGQETGSAGLQTDKSVSVPLNEANGHRSFGKPHATETLSQPSLNIPRIVIVSNEPDFDNPGDDGLVRRLTEGSVSISEGSIESSRTNHGGTSSGEHGGRRRKLHPDPQDQATGNIFDNRSKDSRPAESVPVELPTPNAKALGESWVSAQSVESSGSASKIPKNEDSGAVGKTDKYVKKGLRLMDLSSRGRYDDVKNSLLNGGSVTFRDYDRRTPLHVAAGEGHAKVCALLIENGAEISAKDRWGNTALSDAYDNNRVEVIELLKRHGADGDDDIESLEMLHFCAVGDVSAIRKALTGGADVSYFDYDKRTALHVACSEGHVEVVEILLLNGASPDAVDRKNRTPVDDAITNGRRDVLRILKRYGATIPRHVHESDGDHVHALGVELIEESAKGSERDVKQCLDYGADVNFKHYDRRTALHLACVEGHIEIVKILLDAGADIDAEDRWGITPLAEAESLGRKDICEILNRVRLSRLSVDQAQLGAGTAESSGNVTNRHGDGGSFTIPYYSLSGFPLADFHVSTDDHVSSFMTGDDTVGNLDTSSPSTSLPITPFDTRGEALENRENIPRTIHRLGDGESIGENRSLVWGRENMARGDVNAYDASLAGPEGNFMRLVGHVPYSSSLLSVSSMCNGAEAASVINSEPEVPDPHGAANRVPRTVSLMDSRSISARISLDQDGMKTIVDSDASAHMRTLVDGLVSNAVDASVKG